MWLQGGPYHRAGVASQPKWTSVYQHASKAFPCPQLQQSRGRESTWRHQELSHITHFFFSFSFSRAVRGDAKANPGNQMCVVAVQRPENRTPRGLPAAGTVQWQALVCKWKTGALKLDRRPSLEVADRFSVFLEAALQTGAGNE